MPVHIPEVRHQYAEDRCTEANYRGPIIGGGVQAQPDPILVVTGTTSVFGLLARLRLLAVVLQESIIELIVLLWCLLPY